MNHDTYEDPFDLYAQFRDRAANAIRGRLKVHGGEARRLDFSIPVGVGDEAVIAVSLDSDDEICITAQRDGEKVGLTARDFHIEGLLNLAATLDDKVLALRLTK